jgi:hypothetical protein
VQHERALLEHRHQVAAPHGRYVVKQRREGVDQRVFVPERIILTTKCGKVTLKPLSARGEAVADARAWRAARCLDAVA